jgi:deoxyribonuclease IV
MTQVKPQIGAHVSAAVSLELAFERATHIGAECFQIFISPPQQWLQSKHDTEEIERFKTKASETQIGPNFVHGTYLVNFGTQNPEHLQKSIDWLIYALQISEKLGIQGVIFHTGSHKGNGFDSILPQVRDAIKKVLSNSPKNPQLILETSAGGGGSIGRNFNELGQLLKAVGDKRLKICLDTQHVFASGYDVKSALGLKDVLIELKEEVGLENLVAIHANDSKTEYKSNRDRHENIGDGLIGTEGFELLINHPDLKNVPFILEVPGFAGNGPDEENIKTLKSLRKG